MEIESEMEESVNESSGVIVGGPNEYLRYTPNAFRSVQKREPDSEPDSESDSVDGRAEGPATSSSNSSGSVTEREMIGGFGLTGRSSRYRSGMRVRLLGRPEGLGGGEGDLIV